MSNPSAAVLTIAAGDVGIAELTGANDGPRILEFQRLAEAHYDGYPPGSLVGQPWCAMWVHSVFHRAGVELPHGLSHPWTGTICTTADSLRVWLPAGRPAPAGSIIVACGIHTGIVVRDRGNGLLDTIEGNVGNAVQRMVRARADWGVLVPPAIAAGGAPPAVVMRPSWGFDDETIKPDTWGGWATAEARNEKLDRFKRNNPDLWAAAVRLDRPNAPYAFRSGRKGTYGATWRLGGWASEPAREERIKAYCRARGRTTDDGIRRWRKAVPTVTPTGGTATGIGGARTT